MSTKQSIWKRLFGSSSDKKEADDCCGVKIEEVEDTKTQNQTDSGDKEKSQGACCSN